MLSLLIQSNADTFGDRKWIKGKLGYINEAFRADFSTPDQASGYISTYEDDDALMKDMLFDTFVELHERGDACVIIDRFVVFDRAAYENNNAVEMTPGCSCHRFYNSTVAVAY